MAGEVSQYTRRLDIPNVVGYVVNVHDPLNYDIDLMLDDTLRKIYGTVITNNYTYCDETGKERIGTTYRCRIKGIGLISRGLGSDSGSPPDGRNGEAGNGVPGESPLRGSGGDRRSGEAGNGVPGESPCPPDRGSGGDRRWGEAGCYRSPKKGTMRKIRKRTDSHVRSAHIELIRRCDRGNGWVLCTLSDIDIYRRLLVSIYDPITRENLGEICLKSPYNRHFQPYELPETEISPGSRRGPSNGHPGRYTRSPPIGNSRDWGTPPEARKREPSITSHQPQPSDRGAPN